MGLSHGSTQRTTPPPIRAAAAPARSGPNRAVASPTRSTRPPGAADPGGLREKGGARGRLAAARWFQALDVGRQRAHRSHRRGPQLRRARRAVAGEAEPRPQLGPVAYRAAARPLDAFPAWAGAA